MHNIIIIITIIIIIIIILILGLPLTSGVSWVIGARDGLQFCRPQKS